MQNLTQVFLQSFENFITDLIIFIPKVIIAIIIWFVGKWFLDTAASLIGKVDIPGTQLDNQAINFLKKVIVIVGKVVLFFVVLDYLGIGENIAAALAASLTLAISLAVGLAFGKALEEDAKTMVGEAKKHIRRK